MRVWMRLSDGQLGIAGPFSILTIDKTSYAQMVYQNVWLWGQGDIPLAEMHLVTNMRSFKDLGPL